MQKEQALQIYLCLHLVQQGEKHLRYSAIFFMEREYSISNNLSQFGIPRIGKAGIPQQGLWA